MRRNPTDCIAYGNMFAFRYHLTEILATIVNEYTDWDRPVQHPINIRDETLEALSDAQVVAPVINTADLHSANRRNSYLFVFDYQTKFGDYQQVSFDIMLRNCNTVSSSTILGIDNFFFFEKNKKMYFFPKKKNELPE